jgi:hypothetical protein
MERIGCGFPRLMQWALTGTNLAAILLGAAGPASGQAIQARPEMGHGAGGRTYTFHI